MLARIRAKCLHVMPRLLTAIFSMPVMALEVVEVGTIKTAPANINVFATQVAYANNAVYAINVEPGLGGGVPGANLHTVVRKASKTARGTWVWESTIVEEETLENDFHTQPSIAIDNRGYLHIAYNMHNMPWQYAISKQPHSIAEFEFRGDRLDLWDKLMVGVLGRTSFPEEGRAAIPGNQITYPAFFKDRDGVLYVTYRFNSRPLRAFRDRGQAAGIARYDHLSGLWQAIGAEVDVSREDADLPPGIGRSSARVFARSRGWWPYSLRLAFDKQNNMHATWLWRDMRDPRHRPWIRPMYAMSRNRGRSFTTSTGAPLRLPANQSSPSRIEFGHSGQQFVTDNWLAVEDPKHPVALLSSVNTGRVLVARRHDSATWEEVGPAPFNAGRILFDADGRLWAFGKGLTVGYSQNGKEKWHTVYSDPENLFNNAIKVSHDPLTRTFVVQASANDYRLAKLYLLKY